jgi:hypothetical protein
MRHLVWTRFVLYEKRGRMNRPHYSFGAFYEKENDIAFSGYFDRSRIGI